MKKIILMIIPVASLVFLTACNNAKKTISTPGGSEMLYASRWNLSELNAIPITTGEAHLLFFPGQVNRVSGSTGCNRLNGTFELTGMNFIKFSPLATTRMACSGNRIETPFMEALGKVNNWRISDKQLQLYDGKILLARLNAATVESSSLTGMWELNYISGPRIAFAGLYPDKKPQLTFNLASNEVSGSTSCNGFSSKISVEGDKITIAEPFAKTMIFCEGGGENTFLNMLKKVNKYAVTKGETLMFMIDDVAVMRFAKSN